MKFISARERFEGEFTLPGDKSVTHRAVMLNSAAEGEATVTNALIGEDCLSTCACMRALGAKIDLDGTTMRVRGVERFRAGRELDCGNSGTTIRLLTGFVLAMGSTRICLETNLFPRGLWRASRGRWDYWGQTYKRRTDTRPSSLRPPNCKAEKLLRKSLRRKSRARFYWQGFRQTEKRR